MRYRNPILGRLGMALLSVTLLAMPSALHASAPHKGKKTKASSKSASSKSTSSKSTSSKTRSAKSVSGKSSSHKHVRGGRRNWRHHGQQTVDNRRTEQIQLALIRSHYLDGEPSGAWDARTQEALRRFQAANGWQSKVVPDSRALIKLGLGPNQDRLLNPESAMTSHVEAKSAVATPPSPDAASQH